MGNAPVASIERLDEQVACFDEHLEARSVSRGELRRHGLGAISTADALADRARHYQGWNSICIVGSLATLGIGGLLALASGESADPATSAHISYALLGAGVVGAGVSIGVARWCHRRLSYLQDLRERVRDDTFGYTRLQEG